MDGDVKNPGDVAAPNGRPDFLDAAAWRRLTTAESMTEAAGHWCALMAGQLGGAAVVCVMVPPEEGGPPARIAGWPANRVPDGNVAAAAAAAFESRRGVVRAGADGAGATALAVPVVLDGVAGAVCAAEVADAGDGAVRTAMRRLQWGSAWLSDLMRGEAAGVERARMATVGHALHVVVAAAETEGFEAACRAACTDLAQRFGCDRVAIGTRRFGRSQVRAISHTAQFGKRMNLARQLSAAMDEAIDQRTVVMHPPAADTEVIAANAAAALARAQAVAHVLTVPLYAVDRYIGAVTLERPQGRPFDAAEAETLEAIATTLAPILEEKRQNDRWLVTKLAVAVGAQARRLLGPGRVGYKLTVLAGLALAAFCYFAMADYRVSADASVEGSVRRAVVAAYDGYVAEAPVRAGDRVSEGDLLVRMDDRDLALERLRLVTARQRIELEYEGAIAERDRAEARIKQTQIAQTDAQIGLFDAQLKRVRLTAPFDGLVVSGDLSQSVGAAVRRGEVLLEVAPLDAYRVVLSVDERQIADVAVGQTGTLLVSALPNEPFPIRVEKITPVAEYADGRTTFRVEAALTGEAARLRPGMEGAAKIDIDRRRRIAIWTKPALDWARIWTWRWLEW
ncbi:efflux RND transporter periplasmic adaptor subunit [Sulfitobacter sp. D35]|uniref:efflux RND transporter periplasmic adaptor subunit n=1 Tax=Sulfitobacter sp. D35 TaxID=3083252 RepID=UPI00296FF19A|nr:efflux RND transporter periplasmic adaptor subunit [Sulfitobacter sp. D35]MDW4496655.1 efflux RND transporter periplasmic adaptor subunit [Sulfitobacter sp. D35]